MTEVTNKQSHALSAYLDELLSTEGHDDVPEEVSSQPPESIPQIEPGQDFCASIADIGAMKMAIPVQAIDAVLERPDESLVEQSETAWNSGEYRHQQKTFKLVDCDVLLNPGKAHAEPKPLILLLKNTQWGLLCRAVEQNISIESDSLRWRDDLTNKPWLTATIQQFHCALLDSAVFATWLEQELFEE